MPGQFPSRFALEGRIVTMTSGPNAILDDGAIYIEGDRIADVRPANQPAPDGFGNVLRVRTGDTIYPGFIELHNHLSYNAMPLWEVPQRYSNNGQWKNHEDYRRLITKPAQVLGQTEGVVEAVVRWVECKCLLGGVTASQGITLNSAGGIEAKYAGIVRNVERPVVPGLAAADARIGNPEGGEKYLGKLKASPCYLQHISEGTDSTARKWFLKLREDDGDWALWHSFAGIHSTAFRAEDFQVLADHSASVVWSPLSNLLLYGETLDMAAARASGVPMGLGSDWAPSGSKNILGELKVAWLHSEAAGGVFSPEDLVRMATVNAARILTWDAHVGTIEQGKLADLVAINGKTGDPFKQVIEARESSVTLVLIGGVPRVGQKRLMKRFGVSGEEIQVDKSERVLHLDDPNTHPLVKDVGFAEAQTRLGEAMRNLPVLALQLDGAGGPGGGFFSGSLDSTGARWRIRYDFEEEDEALGLAAGGYADYVVPLELEPPTIAGDRPWLEKIARQRNLPDVIRTGLPAFYGEDIPLPDDIASVRHARSRTPARIGASTDSLRTFLRSAGSLDLEDRMRIAEQARLLVEQNYVHLPLKRAMHAVDPVQALRLLHFDLSQRSPLTMGDELSFHKRVAAIFHSLRDLHTTYRLPAPFNGRIAWLPLLIEEFWERGQRRFLVSKTVGETGDPLFVRGVEVVSWNGTPIEEEVRLNGDRHAGSNADARWARGMNSLTVRPLSSGVPPSEEWVSIGYLDADRIERRYTTPWLVFDAAGQRAGGEAASDPGRASALALDADTDETQEAKKYLYAVESALAVERAAAEEGDSLRVATGEGGIETYLPTVFRPAVVDTAVGRFGYIRIFTFNVVDVEGFVDEFVRLVEDLSDQKLPGLILDVRGNGGGHIQAAERILQALTFRTIHPQRAQFINSPLNLAICERHAAGERGDALDFGRWVDSMRESVRSGATWSAGFPISPPDRCNDIGQRFFGPVVLITDALCYSATDMFAAGFSDHQIGPILGVHRNTGAGGANVWSHGLLRQLHGGGEHSPYQALPNGADLRVAMRRTIRSGDHAGDVLEDYGVIPNAFHAMTRTDIMERNQDLIDHAARLIAGRKSHRLDASVAERDGRKVLEVEAENADRLDVFAGDRPVGSPDVTDDSALVPVEDIFAVSSSQTVEVRLQTFEEGSLVAARRITVSRV